MKIFHSSELQTKPQEPTTYIVDGFNPRGVIADISRPPEVVKSAIFVAAQKDLSRYGVNEFGKSRLIRLRSALYHPHSVWFNHSEFDKDAILIAIESLIGEPHKSLYPVGLNPGNKSKPSTSLSEIQYRAQKVLISYGINVFLVKALNRLRNEIKKPKSYWRGDRYIGKKLTGDDVTKIMQAIDDLLAKRKRMKKTKVAPEIDFSFVKCDQKLKDILINRFPHKPYCCDVFPENRIRKLDVALKKRYIQFNPPNWKSIIAVDVDRAVTDDECKNAGLPPPTWISINPKNGHAHYIWVLISPVWVGGDNQNPARYFTAMQEAYRVALQGDAGFAGLLTKNPISVAWITSSTSNYAKYSLSGLAKGVTLKKGKQKKQKDELNGRNNKLFNETREWAYVEVHQHTDVSSFSLKVQAHIDSLNSLLSNPVSMSEILSTGRSIIKWVWKHRDKLTEPSERARACQKKSVEVRVAKMANKREEAFRMLADGFNIKQIASAAGVDTTTVGRWFKKSETVRSI